MTPSSPTLLMIPGPVEVSPAVLRAYGAPPQSHVSPALIEAFAGAIAQCRAVWRAPAAAQPFIVSGSGTLAMEMAAWNLINPGDAVVQVDSGYFSARQAEILRRLGAEVTLVSAPPGATPSLAEVAAAVQRVRPRALFATHVDTSTGVRVDPAPLAALAAEQEVLSVFDGVCATGGEDFDMASLGADVYYTASQKALGLPPGLALIVLSPRALAARSRLKRPPPLALDVESWLPIMRAYEARGPSYFATPATNAVAALAVGLGEILEDAFGGATGVHARVTRHAQVARAMRAAWGAMGLALVPEDEACAANTLSALYYPRGVGPALLPRVDHRGVTVAGGLHPAMKDAYFRVGHMGYATTQPEMLEATVRAVGEALGACGQPVDVSAALGVLRAGLAS